MGIPRNLIERQAMGRFLEHLHLRHAAIQDVKKHPARSNPRSSRHHGTIQYRTCPVFVTPPFFVVVLFVYQSARREPFDAVLCLTADGSVNSTSAIIGEDNHEPRPD